MAKSGSVSRQRPRSRPTTCRPASASSFARMVPLRPTPTTTASTGFSLVGMSVLSHEQHMLGMAMLVERALALQDVLDRHGQRVVRHAVLLDMGRIRGGNAGEADELPANLLAVAAVDRIRKEAFDGVVEHHVEEEARRHGVEWELALVERMQHLVLLRRRELVERLAVLLGAGCVHFSDRRAIDLLRCERGLIALLRRALGGRPWAVLLPQAPPAPEGRLVNKVGAARLFGTRSEIVCGNEPRDGGIEKGDLGR